MTSYITVVTELVGVNIGRLIPCRECFCELVQFFVKRGVLLAVLWVLGDREDGEVLAGLDGHEGGGQGRWVGDATHVERAEHGAVGQAASCRGDERRGGQRVAFACHELVYLDLVPLL